MERQLVISYPESLANTLKLGDAEFEREMRTISLLKLYELGKISSGMAAKILGINRIDFLDKMGTYKVSIFGYRDEDDLAEDIANA